jgi:hypothetical protein
MNTIGNYFRSLNILHAALCGGVAVCIGVLRFVRSDNTPNGMAQILLIIGVSIAAVCLVVSRLLLFKTVTPARQQASLAHKLALFRSGFIIQMAMLEGAAIINMIFWFIGGNSYNLGIALGLLFLMIFRRPTRMLIQGLAFSANEDSRVVLNDDVEL